MAVDFEAEGLLEGLDGEAREARERLLRELSEDGAELDELREAVEEDRLILLPAERALRGPGRRLNRREVQEETGGSMEFLTRLWTAIGMPDQGPDEPVYTDADVDAVKRALESVEAGVPEEGILEITRVVSGSMSALAASMRRIGFEAFAGDGGSEDELGSRFAWAMGDLVPVFTPVLEYALTLHLHQQVSSDYVDGDSLRSGAGGGEGGEVAVCFADMVGFTKLGEQLEASEVGALSQRLAELAQQATGKRVRVIKMIGDAAMLTAPAPQELVESALELVDLAEREGEGFPQLRAGVACGEALARGGDLYGRPVNLASRITGVARPGSVLCSEAVGDALEADERFELSFARKRELKGFKQGQKLFRVRRAGADGGDGD
ncbi:adenylate/guanylate cyclase domain-containing protein [Thermoleophilia bacterium SCSIO 60948]|nr:adenylate/guanylate cyclase domain-containing protein [Thermoleophilia bacterium SCSIO 60948]